MTNDTFTQMTDEFARCLANNPFKVRPQAVSNAEIMANGSHVGYALGIEDALFAVSKVLLLDAAITPALREKADEYLRSMDRQRLMRRMLGLPTETGAALVK